MDIAAAQLAADRLGPLDHVDVLLRPEFDAEQILPSFSSNCRKVWLPNSPTPHRVEPTR